MIFRFLKYYRPHIFLFIVDFTCAFVMSCLDLVFPWMVRKIVDDVLPAGNVKILIYICAGMLILYLIRYGLQYVVDYWGHVLGVRMEYDMRMDLFDHVQKLSFTYFDNTKTGHIMSRLVNDLNEISEFAHHGPEDLFIATVTLIGSFVLMFSLSCELALIIFSFVPVMLIFAIKKNRAMQNAFRDMRLRIADINAQVEDSISGIRVVKSFSNEWFERRKFERGNANFRRSKEGAYKAMAHFFSGINLFSNLINLAVIAFGGFFIYKGRLTAGELIGFLLYVSMFLQPIRKITNLMEAYQRGMAGFRRFMELMELEPDIVDAEDAIEAGRLEGDIEFDHVTFSYNKGKKVLEDISFRIKKGETVALVGPSGAGKTTLCSLIPRFYEIDGGSIKIDGIDIRRFTQRSLRQNIGIVHQDVFLFSGTIRENIAYGKLNATDEEIIEAAKKANAHEFIMSLENRYDTYVGERGVKLSGGQKQRISIARVFLKDPPILILDEATSALDNETERAVQESLNRLAKDRTTIIIAHRLSTIMHADRIMVLTDEGIVEQGTHDELIKKNGVYAALYRAQYL